MGPLSADPERMAGDDAGFCESDHCGRVQVQIFANLVRSHERLGLRQAKPHTLSAAGIESVMRMRFVTNFPACERFDRRFGSFS